MRDLDAFIALGTGEIKVAHKGSPACEHFDAISFNAVTDEMAVGDKENKLFSHISLDMCGP